MSTLAGTKSPAADADYLRQAVPTDQRKSGWGIASVFFGFIIVAGQMSVGGGLASQLSKPGLITAVLVGNAIAGAFAAFAGYTGAVSGQSFPLLTQEAFPKQTWRLASLYVPLVLIGWYAVEAAIFASILAGAIGAPSWAAPILVLVSVALFSSSTYFGFRGLRYVSYVAVPTILLIGTYAIMRVMSSAEATFGFGTEHLDLGHATALVVGSWIMGALTCVPDLTRFSRSRWTAMLIGFSGIFLGNSFNHFVGAAGAAFAKQYDPALILMTLGLIVPGVIFALANIWTTNDGNMYSASLNAAPVLGLSRRGAVVLCTALAAVLAMFEPQSMPKLFSFLGVLNVTAPALGAVVLGRYWLHAKGLVGDVTSPVPAWVAWIGGSAIAYASGSIWAFATGFAAGFLIYWGACWLNGRIVRSALDDSVAAVDAG